MPFLSWINIEIMLEVLLISTIAYILFSLFINSCLLFKAFISITYLLSLFTVLLADITDILQTMPVLFFQILKMVELMCLMCVSSRLPEAGRRQSIGLVKHFHLGKEPHFVGASMT